MHKKLIAMGIAFFSLISLSALKAEQSLSLAHAQPTMNTMLEYHVEHKTFSPVIVRRSFKIYLEQFDPEHIYFLKKEVEPFQSLTDQEVEEVISDYHNHSFSYYARLNVLIEKAIIRARLVRKTLQEEIKQNGIPLSDFIGKAPSNGYPSSEEELRQKIRAQLINYVKEKEKSKNLVNPSSSVVEKIVDYYEKKMVAFEKKYMGEEQNVKESLLTFHILKAFAKSLDAHTGYYSPEEAFEIRASLKKQFAGVGVVLRQDFDGIFISGLVEGSVASRQGQIQVGDVLVAVNYQGIEHITFEELLRLIQGGVGDKVTLGVKRLPESSEIIHVDLIREKIVMNKERLQVQFEPYAEGVIGTASGYVSGNAFNWKYAFRLQVGKNKIKVKFDDWMFLQEDGYLINIAKVKKFGITLGRVILFFEKK